MKKPLSAVEAAAILGVDRSRVLKLIRDGRLKATKVGNMYIIQRSALVAVKDRKPGRPKREK